MASSIANLAEFLVFCAIIISTRAASLETGDWVCKMSNSSTSSTRRLFLDIALTSRCPFHCRYCSVEKKHLPELSAAEWVSVLASFARLRPIDLISLEGGEPLLRPDLAEILSASLEYAHAVKIVTSGAVPLGPIPRDLVRHPRVFWEVSMDGPREVHDFLRDQSWDRTWDFMTKGLEAGARVRLRSVISRPNLPFIVNWLSRLDPALAPYGQKIGFSFDTMIPPEAFAGVGGPIPRLGLRCFPTHMLIPRPSEMGELFWKLKTRNFEALEVLQTEPIRGCGAARWGAISIDPEGAFSFCCEAPRALGTILRYTAEQILLLLDSQNQSLECQGCPHFHTNLCNGCWTGQKCGMVRYWGAKDCRTLHDWMIDAERRLLEPRKNRSSQASARRPAREAPP